MFNIKTAASAVAAVTVVGVSAHQIYTRIRKTSPAPAATDTFVDERTDEQKAWDRARMEFSKRMLSGYYDDKTDDEANADFAIMYHTYQSN